MERIQKSLFWALILSETSHVFCCVLPTVFTVLSLMAGLGLMSMPAFMVTFHEAIHAWEVPIIMFSGAVVALGWGLHWYSLRIDCHDTGCAHPPCTPVKRRSSVVMKVATALFVANVLIYAIVHRGMEISPEMAVESSSHEGHAHAHEGHEH